MLANQVQAVQQRVLLRTANDHSSDDMSDAHREALMMMMRVRGESSVPMTVYVSTPPGVQKRNRNEPAATHDEFDALDKKSGDPQV